MTPKAAVKEEKLCVAREEAIDFVGMAEGLIENMTTQMKRLKERGYDVTNIQKSIKRAKKGLGVAKRRIKR